MNKISRKNKAKATAILASIIWGATVLTGCPSPITPEPEPQTQYPNTLTTQEMDNVGALSTSTLADSLASMDKIIALLEKHSNEDGVVQYKAIIEKVKAEIKAGNLEVLTNSGIDVNAIIRDIEDNANAIQGDIITFDTSYTDENGVTQSYKNADDYNAAREDAIGKIDEYWNYAHGDYLAELNNYANAVDEAYTNRPAYISVENYAKEIVEDFKDNYIFNNSYDEKEIKTLVNNAKTEQANIQNGSGVAEQKAAYDNATATLSNYETSARNAVNAANNFEFVKQDNTTTTPGNSENNNPENNNPENKDPENKDPENKDPENKDPENKDPENNNPEITYTDATITDISQVTDWSKVGNVTVVATPDANGSVDVMSYYNLKKDVDDKIASLSDGHSRTVAFADYPATVKSFKLSMPSDKTNVELMNSIVNPEELEFSDIEDYSTVAEREAKIKKTEVIPGVNLVSYPAEYFYKACPYNNIQQAFEFEKNTTVTMPSGKYDLGYNGGIIAKNGVTLTIQNLANADMEGTIYKENIPAIYDKFVSGKSASELPKLSLKFTSRGADNYRMRDSHLSSDGVNLYGTDIDHIISAYYNNGLKDRFDFSGSGNLIFDAREYNGGVMYEENTFKSAYNLDTNAALLMDTVANVNIIGENKLGITESDIRLMNTRIETDMSGIEFTGNVNGVLDITGTQSGPLTLLGIYGRLIVRDGAVSSENSSISLRGGKQIDLSEVSEVDVTKIYTLGSFYNYVHFENENAATKANIGATGKTFYGTDNRFGGVNAQQIVETANRGDDIDTLISQLSPRKVAPTKSELLRAILDDNQKTYS